MMEKKKQLPKLPKGIVKPSIITGLEALGRGNDKNKIISFPYYYWQCAWT